MRKIFVLMMVATLFVLPSFVLADGGEDCGTAVAITSLPFTDTGSTTGAVNDYDAVCPYSGSTSPDEVYSYAPAANINIDIDLCASGYDTKVYVYENACTAGTEVYCNDDDYVYCSAYRSYLDGIALTGGNTYYIVIDGYGGASGTYDLLVEEDIPCPFTCPGGSQIEAETCGDDTNGGCNMSVPVFETITDGLTLCGTAWAEASTRDTDWFELVVASPAQFTIDGYATKSTNVGIIEWAAGMEGSGNCADTTGSFYDYVTLNCSSGSAMSDCWPAGTYWFWVGPGVFDGIPCTDPDEYYITVTAASCVTPTPCVFTCPGGSQIEAETCGDDTNGGCNSSVPVFETITDGVTVCGTEWADGGTRDTDWYELVTTTESQMVMDGFATKGTYIGIIEWVAGQEGTGDCANITGSFYAYTGLDCSSGSVASDCWPAGTYWFWIGPDDFYDMPCTDMGEYYFTVNSGICVTATPNPNAACPMDSVYGQDMTTDNGYMSDPDGPFYEVDNFSGVTGDFDTITWWGLETGDNGVDFDLGFYPDDGGGLPDIGNPVYTGLLTATKMDTGIDAFGLNVYMYQVILPSPLTMTDGYFGTVVNGSDGTFWYWSTSSDGDAQHFYSSDGVTYTTNTDDLAFCFGISGPPPTNTPLTPLPIPTTGPGGIGLIIFVISGLLSVTALRRRK